jgi:hypothetical protein
MFWLVTIALACVGMVYPTFTKAFNWLLAFPILAVTTGTFLWGGLLMFTSMHPSVMSWLGCLGFAGVPFSFLVINTVMKD